MAILGLNLSEQVGPLHKNPLFQSGAKVVQQKLQKVPEKVGQFIGQRAADAQEVYEKFGGSGPLVYKEYAKKYAGTFGSRCEEAHMLANVFLGHRGTVENARLSGEMLRMYCDEKVDQAVIARIAKAIEISKQYQYMIQWLEWKILALTIDDEQLPSEPELKAHANTALGLLLRPKRPGVKPFYFGKEGLQPIIGGIGKLICGSAKITRSTPGTPEVPAVPAKKGKAGTPRIPAVPGTQTYDLEIVIGDTYDFDNERTGQYDRFRKHIATLLKEKDYHAFEREYTSKLHAARWSGGTMDDMDKGHVFASYMYALETAGVFKGYKWEVPLPMKGRNAYPVVLPPPPVNPLPDE